MCWEQEQGVGSEAEPENAMEVLNSDPHVLAVEGGLLRTAQ